MGAVTSPYVLVKGMPVGPDGRIHTTYTQNPSTLRFASHSPNLQNLPRANTPWGKMVKDIFIAPPGYTFYAADFSGIEAVLVGYFAGLPDYIRLAKLDVHSFYTAHALHLIDGRVSTEDLPDLSWDDTQLKACLGEIKRRFKNQRNSVFKHLIHAANYMQGPSGAQKTLFRLGGINESVKNVTRLMDIYFELFPGIRQWHKDLCDRVDGARRRRKDDPSETIDDPWTLGVAYAQNPFGYVHRFYHVLEWTKIGSEWISDFGEDANRLIAFLPQSTAAGIIKLAMRTIWEDYPELGDTLRLTIHDELLGEDRIETAEESLTLLMSIMSRPIPELPLDPGWGMGECLSIGVEGKIGRIWSEMH